MSSDKKSGKNRSLAGMIIIAVTAGIMLFAGAYTALTNQAIKETRELTEQTLDFLGNRVTEYKNNLTNDKTKSLIRLLDKTVELAENIEESSSYTGDRIKKYAHEQRISGVAVLDENLNSVMKTPGSHGAEFFRKALGDEELMKVIRYKEASYMHRIEESGTIVDIAAVSRRDMPGAVLCYTKHNSVTDGVNDITLDSMFEGMVFSRDGVVAVTDGDIVLASNKKSLMGKSFEQGKALYTGSFSEGENGLIKLSNRKGDKWYGGQEKISGYTLMAFFSASEIFATRTIVLVVTVSSYVILWLVFILLRILIRRKNLQRAEKNIRMIESIGRIYTTIIETTLSDGSVTVLKLSDTVKKQVENLNNIEDVMNVAYENFPKEESWEPQRKFWDYTTLEARLDGKDSLGTSYRNADGEWISLEIIPQHRSRNGELETVLYLFRNITEDKQKEFEYQSRLRSAVDEAQRASIAKTDFLRRMSHDIRTPINGIRGMLEIAEHYPDDKEKQKECRSKIEQASGFLLDLVNSVLDMNKLESGEIKLADEPFKLEELLESITSVAQIQAEEAGVTYIRRGINAEHRSLTGSPMHLRQILQNLITNAIKYNEAGGYVAVSCTETGADGQTAEFEFVCEDNGIGMSESFQEHAFEAFAQENTDARTMYSGTGLGLAITRELVEAMGGSIKLESKAGSGTRFTVKMRFNIYEEEMAKLEETEKNQISIEGMRILLVEDNDINMEIAEFMLEDKGAEVITACNGLEAVNIFANSETGYFDFILMDVMMPVMDGLAATERIRAMERSDAADIPIFAMTANAFSDDVERSLNAGMNEHLTKPLDMDRLVNMILKYKGEKNI